MAPLVVADCVIRVMVVDDHPIVAESLIAILERDGAVEVVTRASCAADCATRYPAARPDVLILDRNLPDGDGLDVAEGILADDPDARVLILSAEADGSAVRRAVELGCAGYILKTAHPDELRRAVSEVAAGRTVLPSELAAQLAGEMRSGQRRAQTTLSPRESEILTLLCEGKDPASIAESLVVSPLTVKTHLGRLYRKLEVHDRAAAVAKAFRDGLVDV